MSNNFDSCREFLAPVFKMEMFAGLISSTSLTSEICRINPVGCKTVKVHITLLPAAPVIYTLDSHPDHLLSENKYLELNPKLFRLLEALRFKTDLQIHQHVCHDALESIL